ncbi:Zn-ribbon domain-containing protein [Candidatus Woesearchaeota archaeon]|nr:Zn-ribbon domain-containing protein [Candidatus Woesearchaeota archaeon]
MPHQCVRCGTLYDDTDKVIMKGCSCGGKLFFFIKKDKLKQIQEKTVELTPKEKEQIEKDIFDIAGSDIDQKEPVVLDLESIRVLKPGKYELDLVHLFKKEPLIFKLDEGKYMIDIIETFSNLVGKGKKEE